MMALCTLLEKSGDLVSGINKLAEGAAQLKAGAESLDSGAAQLQAGAAQLSSGLNTLNANSSSLNGGARQVFSSLLSMANTQLSEAGLSVPTLTIDNYASVLDGIIASLDDTAVYQAALEQVTATVNANRGMIEERVTEAVQAQVEAEVSAQVTAAVRETVTQAVLENEALFRAGGHPAGAGHDSRGIRGCDRSRTRYAGTAGCRECRRGSRYAIRD